MRAFCQDARIFCGPHLGTEDMHEATARGAELDLFLHFPILYRSCSFPFFCNRASPAFLPRQLSPYASRLSCRVQLSFRACINMQFHTQV
jgi:hypothetical protein